MSEPAETVLAYWNEHRQQMRQSENQRAALTNYILVIVAALSGFIVQQGLRTGTVPLSALIVVIGLYGAVTSAKYHERADYHLSQARALTELLTDLGALPDNKAVVDGVREAHRVKYRVLNRIRLHGLWTGLHVGIALYGAALLVVGVVR
jgi:type IV secretory pathway TrbF-like protein